MAGNGNHGGTKTVVTTAGTLAERCADEKIGAPAIIVIGESARLRGRLEWFEKLPLFGRRIVVTRSREASADFAAKLRALGAEAIEFPTIETTRPSSYRILDGAIARLDRFDWVIFTSATGVEAFVDRLKTLKRDLRSLGDASLCAIGPATAARLEHYALRVAAIPVEYRAESIIPAIGARKIHGARILIPRAQVAREVLPDTLRESGAREVVVAPAYRTVKPAGALVDRMRSLIDAGAINLVTFTSSSTVTNFCALVGSTTALKAAAIGPITADSARNRGFEVVVTPEKYTVPALTAAICDYFNPKRRAVRSGAS